MLHLKEHIKREFEGYRFEEIAKNFTKKQLQLMNSALQRHANHFREWTENGGIPFPGHNKVYDNLLKKDEGVQLIQAMYDEFD